MIIDQGVLDSLTDCQLILWTSILNTLGSCGFVVVREY